VRPLARVVRLVGVVSVVLVALSSGAVATEIRQPTGSPFAVRGGPSAFTLVASGFTPNANVFVEQCDGVPVTTTGWSPTIDCDLGSSPPPASADTNGVVTFDGNKIFHPFQGESPQGLFNCLAPRQSAPANQLRSFTNCQVRVSSNNSAATADQTFLTIVLPPPGTHAPGGVTTTVSVPKTATTSPTKSGAKKFGATPGTKTRGAGKPAAGGATTSVAGQKGSTSDRSLGRAASDTGAIRGGSRTLTGPGALVGYLMVVVGLAIALGAGITSLARPRRAA
jgi:hypothetical protein